MRQQKLLSSEGRSSLQQQGLAGKGWEQERDVVPHPRAQGWGWLVLTHIQVWFQSCPDCQDPQSRMDRELGWRQRSIQ